MREFFILGRDVDGSLIEETAFAADTFSLYYGFECEHPGAVILSYVENLENKI